MCLRYNVFQDGKRITGRRCNEDTFSLQMVDQSGNLHMFLKDELKELVYVKKPLMPSYDETQLSPQSLLDTLAFLQKAFDRSNL